MRQSFGRPPLHRFILPWIFIAVFLAVAPALVFYTAGYRWNPKKNKLEHNGTIILDSVPADAEVKIDGRATGLKTPVTVQNMTPGLYRVSVSKIGYHKWEKNLELVSERVTFATSIWLWRRFDKTFQASTTTTRISVALDDRNELELIQTSPTKALIYTPLRTISRTIEFPRAIDEIGLITWSANGRSVLLEAADRRKSSWLVDTKAQSAPLELTVGQYHWSPSSELLGNDTTQLLSIHPEDRRVTKTPLTSNLVDSLEDAELRQATHTSGLIFVSPRQLEHGLILPAGHWNFWSKTKDFYLFRDNQRWLAVQDKLREPEYKLAVGDVPRPFIVGGKTRYLLVNKNEVWLWDPVSEPELLYRQSERLVAAVWHRSGTNIFLATDSAVFALNLDPRDGYALTQLARFDHIRDMAIVTNRLLVAASVDKQVGVWELRVE